MWSAAVVIKQTIHMKCQDLFSLKNEKKKKKKKPENFRIWSASYCA